MPSLEELRGMLRGKGISLSHQRLKVLEHLSTHACHPTVDQIYHGLIEDIPILSKSTVYNTLGLLVETGVVEARYDVITDFHGHFKCERCGRIHNFGV